MLALSTIGATALNMAPMRAPAPQMMAKSKASPFPSSQTLRFAPPASRLGTVSGQAWPDVISCLPWQVAPMFDAPAGLKGYVGEEDGFDPLGLSNMFDMVRQLPRSPTA